MRMRELDLEQLAEDREAATVDKSDLFDFYNRHWDKVVGELEKLRAKRDMQDAAVEARTLKKICAFLSGFERGIDPSIISELEKGECLKKMIRRLRDKTLPDHDPGDEDDYSYSDSILVDAIEWARNDVPSWKVELLQKLARDHFGKK